MFFITLDMSKCRGVFFKCGLLVVVGTRTAVTHDRYLYDIPTSLEAVVASTSNLTEVPTPSKPPPPPVLSSAKLLPVVSKCILNAFILHQCRHF